MKKKQEEKRGERVFPQPPELQTEFVKDLASILDRVDGETDKQMFKDSKDLTEIYLRTPMTSEEFKKMRTALKQVYSEHKMKSEGKGPDEEFLKRIDAYFDHVAELRNRIDSRNSIKEVVNSTTNNYIR